MIEGIDISIWTSPADWTAAQQQSGVQFAFIECARGLTIGDDFAKHWKACKAAGVIRGPYQRMLSTFDGADQAAAFIKAFKQSGLSIDDGDLAPVLDLEYDDDHDTVTVDRVAYLAKMRNWIDDISTTFNRKPIIYTSARFWNEFMLNANDFASLALWVAQYEVAAPDIPSPWQSWTFWQYAAEKPVAGFSDPPDLNHFNGTIEQLQKLTVAS
jgi:lysozyme